MFLLNVGNNPEDHHSALNLVLEEVIQLRMTALNA
jgi:hypothetical protein